MGLDFGGYLLNIGMVLHRSFIAILIITIFLTIRTSLNCADKCDHVK